VTNKEIILTQRIDELEQMVMFLLQETKLIEKYKGEGVDHGQILKNEVVRLSEYYGIT
jgi:hypothetical protein